jgi:hypothetical protein
MEFLNQTIGKYQLTRLIGKVGISNSVRCFIAYVIGTIDLIITDNMHLRLNK